MRAENVYSAAAQCAHGQCAQARQSAPKGKVDPLWGSHRLLSLMQSPYRHSQADFTRLALQYPGRIQACLHLSPTQDKLKWSLSSCTRPPTELGHPQELIPEQLSYLAWALTGSPLGPFSPGAPLRPASPCNDSDWGMRENDDAKAWGS